MNHVKRSAAMLSGGQRFATVGELLEFLPADERSLTEQLRELVVAEAPELKERMSFNVPFYKGLRDVCFIWPASVLWGKRKTYEGVRFGLSYGSLLVPGSEPYLQRGHTQASALARPDDTIGHRHPPDPHPVTSCRNG
jgi:hypothetical protein